ncbi:MAG: hypothetical protein NVS4B12_29150 [Ktedonobacteraceae bacterium]
MLGLGVAGIIIGVALGFSSHQVTYQDVQHGQFEHYIHDSGTSYMTLQNSSTIYVINEGDFSPSFNYHDLQSSLISFVYRPDQTTDVDVTSDKGTHLTGTGYTVVKITSYDTTGQNPQSYATADYTQHPQGYNENDWTGGIFLLFIGLILLGVSIFWLRRKKRLVPPLAYNAALPGALSQQNGIPGQNQPYAYPNPYQQPYAPNGGAAQYPQYPQPLQQQPQQWQVNPYENGSVAPAPYNNPPPQGGNYEKTQLANSNNQ